MNTENTEATIAANELDQCVIEASELLLVSICGGMDAFANE